MKDNSTPAFPCTVYKDIFPHEKTHEYGMSLRDYFAAKAMQGLISIIDNDIHINNNYHHTANEAYQYADAMLKTREESNGTN